METTKEGRDIVDQIMGRTSASANTDIDYGKSLLEDAKNLTKKYRAPTAEDVTDLLQKKVTDEILKSTQGAKQLDLENIAFNQGARLMANGKCLLPKGS